MVGDKWSVLIIGTLAEGPVRYSELADAIPGIDPGTSLPSTVLDLAAWSADHHREIRDHRNAFDAEATRAKR
ncbi:winged helix-turn-helix transcriptional regulator [Streptomyces sp. SS7]|uniref:winged helix-turn-helix transcriptional regulator n=1 Tax=Streptomyces sp. SS7 TaxID=3108485 RepID=UPI0030ECF3CE